MGNGSHNGLMLGHQKRSNTQVMADVLRPGEAGKTEIMYQVNMSYHQLQRYLGYLIDRGLLDKIVKPNPGVRYRVTPKGPLHMAEWPKPARINPEMRQIQEAANQKGWFWAS